MLQETSLEDVNITNERENFPSTKDAPETDQNIAKDIEITIQITENKTNEPTRLNWGNRFTFILSTVGAAVGFGNFLRFPYLVYRNGGGVFLIPYILAIIFLGEKIMLLELSLGQITQKTAVKSFQKIAPKSIGIGVCAVFFGSFIILTYYNVIICWSIIYFIYSFVSPLPWTDDPQRFFYDVILEKSSGLWVINGISWKAAIALLFVWVFIFFSVWKGIKSLSIVSYLTVPLPFIVLIIFIIRGFFLPGSWTGIYYYLKPDFSKLFTSELWLSAIGQVFFSMSLAAGIMTGYASYNKKKQNIAVDTVTISIIDASFSIFSGFCIFQILGYMAFVKNTTIDQVTTSGIGLAYVAFPDALASMPWSNFFSVIFFFTLFSLGISSANSLCEACTGSIKDAFPQVDSLWISLFVCISGYLCGIIFTLSNGFYFLDLVDHYTSDYCLVGIGLLECVLIGYFIATTPLLTKLKDIQTSDFQKIKDYIKVIVSHSIEEWREKIIKEISPPEGRNRFERLIGPHFDFSLTVKFLAPFLLGILLLLNVISELISPYGKDYGLSSLIFAVIPVSCFGIIIATLFIPQRPVQEDLVLEGEGVKDDGLKEIVERANKEENRKIEL